jgi:hypothetical protein
VKQVIRAGSVYARKQEEERRRWIEMQAEYEAMEAEGDKKQGFRDINVIKKTEDQLDAYRCVEGR